MADDPSPRPRLSAPDVESGERVERPRRSWSRTARLAAWVTGGIAAVIVLFVFVFPTRTYLDQRHQLNLAAERVRVLDQQNKQLAAEADRLRTPDEIQRIARAQYHMVKPGEKAFVVLPSPAPTTTTTPPPAAPSHRNWWDALTSWLP